MGFEHAEWDYVDGIYLLMLPLAQFACVVGVLYLFRSSMHKCIRPEKNITAKECGCNGSFSQLGCWLELLELAAPDKSSAGNRKTSDLQTTSFYWGFISG